MVYRRTRAGRAVLLQLLCCLAVLPAGCVHAPPAGGATKLPVASATEASLFELDAGRPGIPASGEWTVDPSGGITDGHNLASVALDDAGKLGFAVGGGGIVLRWNGATWKKDDAAINVSAGSDLRAVAIDPTGKQALVVGDNGFMMSWNGSAWKREKVAEKLSDGLAFFAVAIDSKGRSAWAVGQYGIALHRVGSKWVRTKTPYGDPGFVSGGAPVDVFGIWSVWINPNGVDAVAGAHKSEVVRWNGSAWKVDKAATSQRADPNPFGGWSSIAMSRDGSNGWMVGSGEILHWNGSKWMKQDSNDDDSLVAVATDGQAKTAVAVGPGGVVRRWDGTKWSNDKAAQAVAGKRYLQSVALNSAGNLGFIVGEQGFILRWDGQSWQQDPISEKASYAQFSAISLSADGSKGLAVGSYGDYLHWDGATWSTTGAGNPTRFRISSLWMSPQGDRAFGLSQDGIYKWDGSTWSSASSARTLMDLALSANGKFGFAVGFFGQVFRYDGSSWQLDTQGKKIAGDATFYSVALNADGNVGFAGGSDIFLRWDGVSWKKDAKLSKGTFGSICLDAKGDLGFAWGDSAAGDTFMRWDGKQWRNDQEANKLAAGFLNFSMFLSADGTKGFAVSLDGLVLVWDHGKWHKDAEASRLVRGQYPISACLDATGESGWIIGMKGFLLRYQAPKQVAILDRPKTLLGRKVQ